LNGAVTILPAPDARLSAALRADLESAGYTADAVRAAWGALADEAVGHGLHGPALTALAGRGDALAVLARTLFLGVPASRAEIDAALPHLRADGLVRLGLARIDEDAVVPAALVRPQDFAEDSDGRGGQWWIASDLDEAAIGGPLPTGHVLGVGGASLTLAGLQLGTPVHRVLDVGTGCGIQALRARRAGDEVVATDVSERALRYTQLNALLNGVDGIEVRHGSLFDPVAGELFDRVVSNPPFVITPRAAGVPAYEYRDAGFGGDDLVAAFVSGVGAVLAPGGTAQLLGNWEYRAGADGLDRVRGWVEASPTPLEAWVVERELLDPLAYAELWVRDGGTAPGTPGYAELVQAWLDDFAARGVTAVGFGYLLLRRPGGAAGAVGVSGAAVAGAGGAAGGAGGGVDGAVGAGGALGATRGVEGGSAGGAAGGVDCAGGAAGGVPESAAPLLARYERVTQPVPGALGAHLGASLAAWDRLAVLDDDALAEIVLTVAGDVSEARHHLPGQEAPSIIELRQGGGFARTVEVDPALAALVGACDGDLPVGALIAAIADLLEVDADALRADLLPRVRELVLTGFLAF